jgi:ABC-type uncharacterized transport system auxiliary subunit
MGAVCVALTGMLAGCGGLRSDRAVEQVYVLQPLAPAVVADPVPAVLRVSRPDVQPGLDTNLIAVTRPGNELDYIAASRWGTPLPKVLSAFAVESLSRSGVFKLTVGAETGGVQGDFELLLTARHFEAAYPAGGGAPTARVAFDCVLTSGTPRRVIGRCDASAESPAADNRVGAIVQALEQAAQQALGSIGTTAAQLARSELAVRK